MRIWDYEVKMRVSETLVSKPNSSRKNPSPEPAASGASLLASRQAVGGGENPTLPGTDRRSRNAPSSQPRLIILSNKYKNIVYHYT